MGIPLENGAIALLDEEYSINFNMLDHNGARASTHRHRGVDKPDDRDPMGVTDCARGQPGPAAPSEPPQASLSR